MLYLTLPFDFPVVLPPLLEAALGKLAYWLYLSIWHLTGATVLFDRNLLLIALVGAVVGGVAWSIGRDVRAIRAMRSAKITS